MCRRYSLRPSDVVGISDAAVALDFDMAMAYVHSMEEHSKAIALTQEHDPMLAFLSYITRTF